MYRALQGFDSHNSNGLGECVAMKSLPDVNLSYLVNQDVAAVVSAFRDEEWLRLEGVARRQVNSARHMP